MTGAIAEYLFALCVWFVLAFPVFLGSFLIWRRGRHGMG